MRTLVWLRADLRIADNPALARACEESGGEVVAVFLISPEQWKRHDWAAVKVEFILRHLEDLSERLAEKNIALLIQTAPTFDDAPDALLKLARAHGCEAVYFNAEHEVNELRRDAAVQDRLAREGIIVRSFLDQCLVQPGGVRTGEGRFYTVFSPFKRALYARLGEHSPPAPLPAPRKQDDLKIKPSRVPESVEGFGSGVSADSWPVGEQHAAKRLAAFIEQRLHDYKSDRDLPALDATSVLSPYLAVGSISIRQCLTAALEANQGRLDKGDAGAVHWISELAWREFYRHILVGFPRVCMHRAFKPATERLRWSNNEEQFKAWCEGKTGVPIVDAGMRQLRETGWMHNRVRMITAMYLTKDLFIDWRRGEKFFMQHLIDGDLASNNGGWQWSASTGTDAAPYFRIFNPISQSRKCDPEGEYIRRYVPELASLDGDGGKGPIHDPSGLPGLLRGDLEYPQPIVDHAKARDRAIEAFQALPAG